MECHREQRWPARWSRWSEALMDATFKEAKCATWCECVMGFSSWQRCDQQQCRCRWAPQASGAGQIYGPARPRPSRAPPSANPLALLDANEQRHPRDGAAHAAHRGARSGAGYGRSKHCRRYWRHNQRRRSESFGQIALSGEPCRCRCGHVRTCYCKRFTAGECVTAAILPCAFIECCDPACVCAGTKSGLLPDFGQVLCTL